ncbi:MAG: DUF3995 domain-containing protein [Dietzia psychralcaliphila]
MRVNGTPDCPTPSARAALWVAASLGTVHAAWSAYWAFGGRILLDTVGVWAVSVVEERPLMALGGLLAVAVVKFLAAWIPLLAETRRIPGRPVWRGIAWVGGPFLITYGTVNAAAAAAILAGWVETGSSDRPGLIGHALLWDPLFALWGAALTFALVVTRRT